MGFSPKKVFRYLKFKNKLVNGLVVARHMGIPLRRLDELNSVPGLGGLGPCYFRSLKNRSNQFWHSYAKNNMFSADFICFFRSVKFQFMQFPYVTEDGMYMCIKDRPLRKGANKPKKRTLLSKT